MSRPTGQAPRALISVSDKSGLLPFARGLSELGFEVISTGGTAGVLREAGLHVIGVSEITGFPEIMDGRVKTLHPLVHGGLLARRGTDEAALEKHGIPWIDLLAVNLYPFEATIMRPDCTIGEAIENIDVGGPAMIRAAAKNHSRLTVVVDPRDYERILGALREGGPPDALKRSLAIKAFAHTARYDAIVSRYLAGADAPSSQFPDPLVLAWDRDSELRYGENPHQKAAFFRTPVETGGTLARVRRLQGKPLSFNNLADADAALQCVNAFEDTACVIVKHANPCGVAVASSAREAYGSAYRTDPTSAFGGVIALNRPLDVETAAAITENQLLDVLVAPSVEADALEAMQRRKNARVIVTGGPQKDGRGRRPAWDIRSIAGGILVQDHDDGHLQDAQLKTVTERSPTESERRDLLFAWTVVKYVKSNAIVYARDRRTLGVGAGQMSRVVSARIAAMKAGDEGIELESAVMASDAFFPFRDGIDMAADHGIRAVIQPGGSVRDDEVIQAANEHGMAMVFTGMRHFRH
jgi:phosphoribosylaminoimidazolecarboxamide formyltransferase/IMP cyclohydrolase